MKTATMTAKDYCLKIKNARTVDKANYWYDRYCFDNDCEYNKAIDTAITKLFDVIYTLNEIEEEN